MVIVKQYTILIVDFQFFSLQFENREKQENLQII